MIILFYDCYRILSEVYKNGAYLKQAVNDVQIEELNRAKTTKICYGVLDKNVELDYVISSLCNKKPKSSIVILLKIAIYSIKYLEKKPYAVIDATVELSKKIGKGANAGFINAVLRKFVNTTITLPDSDIERLSVKYSYPVFAVRLLLDTYKDLAEDVMAYDEEFTYVRFKKDFDGESYLQNKNYTYTTTPFKNLFSVPKMKMDEDFYKGIYTFQSIGSVAICDQINGGGDVLDACAAPGGKSCLIAERAKSVTSCEIHEHRAKLITSYLTRMNLSNVKVICCDSSENNPDFNGKFDVVLCDVPCSGYGTVKNNPDIKLKQVDFNDLTDLQLKIARNCLNYVKKGGYLVYSTCSVFREENDAVIEKLIDDSVSVDKCFSPLPNIRTEYGLQFLPNISSGAGFYVCRLLKK